MAYAYKKLRITKNAIVPKGAMRKKAIYKEDGSFKKTITLLKNEEKLEVTACLIKFDEFDSQDMILDDENVRDEAMIDFLIKGDKTLKILHKTKDEKESHIDAFLKEIYVAKEDNVVNAPAGSVITTYKFANKEDWDVAKGLDLEFSLEGEGTLVEVAKEDKPMTKTTLKGFIEKNKEAFEGAFGKEAINKLFKKEDKKEDEKEDGEIDDLKKEIKKLSDSQVKLQKMLSQRITSISIEKNDEEESGIDINKIEL